MPPGASAAASDAPGAAVPRLLCLTAAAAAGGGLSRLGLRHASGLDHLPHRNTVLLQ